MSTLPTSMNCIPANPDISGLGVRMAIYIQNILSLVPAIWALRDGNVTLAELEVLQKQSVTILLTAFAILISTIVQALTSNVTSYHATIILNLSWMNNTNTFIYLLLYAHHIYHQFLRSGQTKLSLARYWWQEVQKESQSRKELKQSGEVIIAGSLHLTLMAAVGIWLWSQPAKFGIREGCSLDAAVFFSGVRLSSVSFRGWSLFFYGLILLPGLNLMGPACLFFFLYLASWQLIRQLSKKSPPIANFLHEDKGRRVTTLSISLGLVCVFTIDIVILALTESQIRLNANLVRPGDTDWTFGQILAILLLVVPLRELLETVLERNSSKLGEILLHLCRLEGELVVPHLLGLGAPVDFKGIET
ncbi:hypothetical protein NP233_g13001 [Leucocoprinus birnbaumii]|uniref:Uncharacterized protein n=1 Tax=Leucocoprinus birnbaumii TaxID=56174 RepID=A0AAD5YJX3_9AGAR|nr:hypothetical protein NP233_g13001 [Leucocoprinus birnbaumii]